MKMKFLSFFRTRAQPIKKIVDSADPTKLLTSDDDSSIMMQIQTIHSPDSRNVDNQLLIQIVARILHLVSYRHDSSAPVPDSITDHGAHEAQLTNEKALLIMINKLSLKISLKSLGKEDVHKTTMVVLEMLSSYSWEGKTVIALAAFSLLFGEFLLVLQLSPKDKLAKSIENLKKLSTDHTITPDKLKLESLFELIKTMLDLANHIIEFKKIPTEHKPDTPLTVEMVAAATQILPAVYWIIRGIVDLSSVFVNYHRDTVSSAEDILGQKISDIKTNLKQRINIFQQYVDARIRSGEVYARLVRFFQTPQTNNMEILKALTNIRNDTQQHLSEDYTQLRNYGRVKKNIRGKVFCLLISSIHDTSIYMIEKLALIYEERVKPDDYEIVWLPIVDDDILLPRTWQSEYGFNQLTYRMPWLFVSSPQLLDVAVLLYIKEQWEFTNKPILVTFDQQGNLTNLNALHMIWIWKDLAFPFTKAREEQLWNTEKTWTMHLFIDWFLGYISCTDSWRSNGNHVCFYGGEDMEWITNFTTLAKEIAKTANIELRLFYAGTSKDGVKIRKNINNIECYVDKRYGETLPIHSMWYFWERLESMWQSKVKLGKSVDNDEIMQEIKLLLSFKEWAVFSSKDSGGTHMTRANGEMMLLSMSEFEKWKHRIEDIGFVPALNEYLLKLQPENK